MSVAEKVRFVPSTDPIVRIENLQKSFGDNVVLRDVNLEVHRGEVVVVLGPSGSGKSTMLRCINLLETPTGGHIYFEDTDITAKGVDINQIRAEIGMVFQNFNLFPQMTAKKNVMIAQQKVLKRKPWRSHVWRKWGWPIAWTTSLPSFRAASSSAWPSPAPWPWSRM